MVAVNLAPEYGYVLAVALGLYLQQNILCAINVGMKRKATGEWDTCVF